MLCNSITLKVNTFASNIMLASYCFYHIFCFLVLIMFGLIFFVSVLAVAGMVLFVSVIKYEVDEDYMVPSIFCFIAIIALLSYWFSGATPRNYTSKKYQELDKKYHLETQVALQDDRNPVLLQDVNKVIYRDDVGRWHLFFGLVSFNQKSQPCVRIIKDKNNYSTAIQDEILKVDYHNNLLRYLTFVVYGIASLSVIEYTCVYDVATV